MIKSIKIVKIFHHFFQIEILTYIIDTMIIKHPCAVVNISKILNESNSQRRYRDKLRSYLNRHP